MGRSKFEKSMDSRGVGFTAIDALNEHNAQAAKAAHKPAISKPGLPFYTERELEKKAGEVTSFNMNSPITFEEFKKMKPDTRKVYITGLTNKYEGINTTDIAKMMGGPYGSVATLLRDSGIKFPRGGNHRTEGRLRFQEEMIPKVIEENIEPAENTEASTCLLTSATFHCDVSEVAEVINRLGMAGRVYVKICISNKGGKQDDGFN